MPKIQSEYRVDVDKLNNKHMYDRPLYWLGTGTRDKRHLIYINM
jgi:hypothetical protein